MSRLREWLQRLAGTFGGAGATRTCRRSSALTRRWRPSRHGRNGAGCAAYGCPSTTAASPRRIEAQRDQRGFPWLSTLGRDFRYSVRSLLRDRGLGRTGHAGAVARHRRHHHHLQRRLQRVHRRLSICRLDARRALLPAGQRENRSGPFRPTSSPSTARGTASSLNVLAGRSGEVLYQWEGVTYYTKSFYLDPQVLPALGVRPILGRELTDADGAEGAPPTFLISDRLWAERFNRDPGVIGMTLKLNGTAAHVHRGAAAALPAARRRHLPSDDVHRRDDRGPARRPAHEPASGLDVRAAQAGCDEEQAAANITAVARSVAELFPDRYRSTNVQATVRTLADLYTAPASKRWCGSSSAPC